MSFTVFLCHLAKIKYYVTYVVQYKMLNSGNCRASDEYWNERAKFYGRQYGRELRLRNLESILSENRDRYKRVMELGCGIGANLRVLAPQFPQVVFTGVDHSERMLTNAADNLRDCPNVKLIQADLAAIDRYPWDRQDLVFSRAVLQHLSPSAVRKAIGYIFARISEHLYLEEISIQGYPDGKALKWPGFPADLYFSHDYASILRETADIRDHRYRRGIILQLFCTKKQPGR